MSNIPPPPPVTYTIPPPPPTLGIPPPPPSVNQKPSDVIGKKSQIKHRRVIWEKIPESAIKKGEGENIWSSTMGEESSNNLTINLETIDELFAVTEKNKSSKSASLKSWKKQPSDNENKSVTLLDNKKSLNVNIFLRQFKKPTDDIVKSIAGCNNSILQGEHLRTLLKLLPSKEEAKTLKAFKGDVRNLDAAEKFFLKLISIPSYSILIEFGLLRDEFGNTTEYIEVSLNTLEQAMREIRSCKALPKIMHLVLQAGNYLNQGASYGNASGFRLASLKALSDTKANKPGITLMHYVAMTLESQNIEMMNWPQELPSLSKACKISDTELSQDIEALGERLTQLKSQIKKLNKAERKLLDDKLKDFLDMAENFLKILKGKNETVSMSTKHMAFYLCENPKKFKLQECFGIVNEFRNKFTKAAEENRKREAKKKKHESKISSKSEIIGVKSEERVRPSTPDFALEQSKWKRENHSSPLQRRNTVSTPHKRYENSKQNSTSDTKTFANVDVSKMQHVTLTKLKPLIVDTDIETKNDTEISTTNRKHAWEEQTPTNKNINEELTAESLTVTTRRRRSRRGHSRSLSLRDGLWGNGEADNRERLSPGYTNMTSDDMFQSSKNKEEIKADVKDIPVIDQLENKYFIFYEKERQKAFERTRMRRSYIRLDKAELYEEISRASDKPKHAPNTYNTRSLSTTADVPKITLNDDTKELSSENTSSRRWKSLSDRPKSTSYDYPRRSLTVSDSEEVSKKKHDDIRERIRKYKESTSSKENSDKKNILNCSDSNNKVQENKSKEKMQSNKPFSKKESDDDKQSKPEDSSLPDSQNEEVTSLRKKRSSARLARLKELYSQDEFNDINFHRVIYPTKDNNNNVNIHIMEPETDIFSDLASKELDALESASEREGNDKDTVTKENEISKTTNLKVKENNNEELLRINHKSGKVLYKKNSEKLPSQKSESQKKKTTKPSTSTISTERTKTPTKTKTSLIKSVSSTNISSSSMIKSRREVPPNSSNVQKYRKSTTVESRPTSSLAMARNKKLSSSALNLSNPQKKNAVMDKGKTEKHSIVTIKAATKSSVSRLKKDEVRGRSSSDPPPSKSSVISSRSKTNFIEQNKTIRVNKTAASSSRLVQKAKKNNEDDLRNRSVSDPVTATEVQSKEYDNPKHPLKTKSTLHIERKKTITMPQNLQIENHTPIKKTTKAAPSSYKYQSLTRSTKKASIISNNNVASRLSKSKLSVSRENLYANVNKKEINKQDSNAKAIGSEPKYAAKSSATQSITSSIQSRDHPSSNRSNNNSSNNLRSMSSVNLSQYNSKSQPRTPRSTRKALSSRSTTDINKDTQAFESSTTGVKLNRAARLRQLMKSPKPEKKPLKVTHI